MEYEQRPYFGPGGRYDIEDLRTRVVMLDMVKAEVNNMNQELHGLMQEVLALPALQR